MIFVEKNVYAFSGNYFLLGIKEADTYMECGMPEQSAKSFKKACEMVCFRNSEIRKYRWTF